MSQGRYVKWIHPVSNKRWIVAERRGTRWLSRITTSGHEVRGVNPLDLVAKGAITYASRKTAIRAYRRVYNADDAGEARPEDQAQGDDAGPQVR